MLTTDSERERDARYRKLHAHCEEYDMAFTESTDMDMVMQVFSNFMQDGYRRPMCADPEHKRAFVARVLAWLIDQPSHAREVELVLNLCRQPLDGPVHARVVDRFVDHFFATQPAEALTLAERITAHAELPDDIEVPLRFFRARSDPISQQICRALVAFADRRVYSWLAVAEL